MRNGGTWPPSPLLWRERLCQALPTCFTHWPGSYLPPCDFGVTFTVTLPVGLRVQRLGGPQMAVTGPGGVSNSVLLGGK